MSSQDVPAYSYQPLARSTSIRILVLKPSLSFEDPLEAKLMHADRSIDDEPTSDKEMRNIFSDLRYEAVSYCWGKADFTHTLICDGKWLGITANVNSMLRHLRKPSKPRHLWVDALCLNQTDMQEKAVQVQLMGDIYKQAHKVQIWLGENDEDDYILEVYGLLKALAVTSNAVFLTQRREEMRNLFKKAMEPAFDRFVARPWFSRKWILQEVYHGKSITIRCGRTKIPWFWVRDGICAIEEIMRRVGGSFLTSHTKTMRHIWGLQKLSSQPSSIMDLLYEFSGTECSDQRDRLYALFNMAIDMSVEDISVYDSVICAYGSSRVNKKIYFPVNYSNHWVDVYTDFARACLSPGRELNFLQHMVMFGTLVQKNPSWPSWVPDWTNTKPTRRRFTSYNRQSFNEDSPVWLGIGFSEKPHRRVILRVIVKGTATTLDGGTQNLLSFNDPAVQTKGAKFLSEKEQRLETSFLSIFSSKNLRQDSNDLAELLPLEATMPSPIELSELFSRAIIDSLSNYDYGEYGRLNKPSQPFVGASTLERYNALSSFGDVYDSVRNDLTRAFLRDIQTDPPLIKTSVWATPLEFALKVLGNRKIFFLHDNDVLRAGIGPPDLKIGDTIVRLACESMAPSSTAFALRHLPKDVYTFVGMCILLEISDADAKEPVKIITVV